MKKGRQGFGGGSIFRTSYIPVPINKTSSLGLNKALSVVIVDREQTTKQPTKSVEPRKSVSKKVRSVPKGKVKDLPELAYFKVQYSQTFEKLCNAPWVIFVSAKDGKGLRLASDFGHDCNVEIKESFKTREEAVAAGKSYISKWGSMRNCEGQPGGVKVV